MTPEPNNPHSFTPNSLDEKARTPARVDKNGGGVLNSSKKLDFAKHDAK